MRWSRSISMLGVHAEGEIGKVIVGGVLDVPGQTMLDKLRHLNEVDDRLRRFCTLEPRGFAQQSVNLLLPACEPGADAGFIVMQPDRCHAMSGSNAICVTTVLLETGMVAMHEPQTRLVLDTAAGLVEVVADCREGICRRVSMDMPASYAEALDITIPVEGIGEVGADIAFGGVFYLLVDPHRLGLEIGPRNARHLVEVGMRVLSAARQLHHPVHPERPALSGLAYCMFAGRDQNGPRNATVMPPGRLDRSPCGTGSSARLATMFTRGEIGIGERLAFRSTIASLFETEILGTCTVGDRPAIRSRITGRGWIYSREEIGIDPDDPFQNGHMLSDCWGPDAD